MASEKLPQTGYEPRVMEMVKRIGVLLLVGALVGDVVATLIAPGIFIWYGTGTDPISQNCATMARGTVNSVIRSQVIGAAIGAVVIAIIGALLLRALAAKRSHKEPATPPPAA
ncbi:MAG: hypothetical protein ACJ790_03550 [Myxococcaceae bacterium]